jgi:hypothetical protein
MLVSVPLGARYASPPQQQILYVTEQVTKQATPKTVYVTERLTQQVTLTTYITQTQARQTKFTGPNYVLVRYSGTSYSRAPPDWQSWCSDTPASGKVFLIVSITVENHGYEYVSVSSYDFYVTIGNLQIEGSGYCLKNALQGPVLNGLMVTGSYAYQVPASYDTFDLLWNQHEYNVQYVHQ